MNNIIKIIVWLTISVIAIIATSGLFAIYTLNSTAVESEYLKINIPNGAGINRSVEILAEQNALNPAWFFKMTASFVSDTYGKTIKAGSHRFPKGITKLELLRALFTGEHLYFRRISFPEGISLQRFASILKNRMDKDSALFISFAKNDSLLKARGIPQKTAEGYLHPATYSFDLDISELKVLDILLNTQDKLWNDKFDVKAREQGKSRHTILTMASIVEAEAPLSEERPRVAGVYWNRIAKGMLLQADPTVQYAKGDKSRVLYADLQIDHLYNTYKYPGLPPGPINSPSETAISAALNPEPHQYLFFVAVGDGSGKHNFAKNYDDHLRYVRIFRNNVKKGK